MHPALTGALVGLAVAIAMMIFDYIVLRGRAAERAKRQHKTVAEFDETEKKQLSSLVRYCIFLPAGFALLFWALA
jgi:hypothetical protein